MSSLIIGGPTATGKSALAIELAKEYSAVIVSADAMTVYRGLDVGTAKPSQEERQQVLHYGIDVREPTDPFSVGDFVKLVETVQQHHQHVIIAGGTPYYLAALVRPLAPLPESDPAVRERLNAIQDPYVLLGQIDPEMAERLHPNDKVRVVRALEVYELTGKTLSWLQRQPPKREPIKAEISWLDVDALRPRIGIRIEQMMANGYLEECKNLIEEGVDLSCKPLRSFSYRWMIHHIQGGCTRKEAIEKTEIGTWHLARKQRTWARNMGWVVSTEHQVRELAKECFSSEIIQNESGNPINLR